MREMKLNGLYVMDSGFPDSKENMKTILFLHGFPYSHKMWHNQITFLSQKFRCVAFDLRGLGQSEISDGQYTIESYCDDVENLIQEMKIHKPILCGFSMGGYVSLRSVERAENLYSALILVNSKAAPDADMGRIKRAQGIKTINEQGLSVFVDSFVPHCFAPENTNSKIDFYSETLAIAQKSNSTGVKGALLAMASRTDTRPFLSQIKLPLLCIAGAKDALIPAEEMRSMVDSAYSAKARQFHVSAQAGHMAPLEDADFVNQKILQFLNEEVL